jgi:hypothetical protein
LAQALGRSLVLLGRPEDGIDALLRARFWESVCSLLEPYRPCALGAVAAIRLWSEDLSIPKSLDAWTRSSSARIALGDLAVLRLEKRPALFDPASGTSRTTRRRFGKHYALSLESPESILTGLRPAWIRDAPELVSAFLKSIRFDRQRLGALAEAAGKPAKLARLALLLRRLGREAEAARRADRE